MLLTAEALLPVLQNVCGAAPAASHRPLAEYLRLIPRLESLADLPPGTPVLVRGDVDAKPGEAVGDGDVRLRSMRETLEYGRQRGWKQIVFGHIGREPEKSLKKVAHRIGQIMNCAAPLIENWWDEGAQRVADHVTQTIQAAQPGSLLVLENTRRYAIERVLWKAKPAELPSLAAALTTLANEMAAKIARVYVNEALSAGSLDASTTVVPAAMDRVALGKYVAAEFDGPMMRCLATQLVVFSGLKTDKLDDLQAMIDRGTVKMVFAAGSLAMALKKAAAELAGENFGLGVAELPENASQPFFISRQRIDQAKEMIHEGRDKGIEFVLPIDFVLQDGQVSQTIGRDDQQFDVGPQTSDLFASKLAAFAAAHRGQAAVCFHNGVFGKFEDPRFENGTKRFISALHQAKQAGVEVYIGGGEGGAALEKYGQPDWVTHCFTAGGTVLNALGSQPVPYLVALSMAAQR